MRGLPFLGFLTLGLMSSAYAVPTEELRLKLENQLCQLDHRIDLLEQQGKQESALFVLPSLQDQRQALRQRLQQFIKSDASGEGGAMPQDDVVLYAKVTGVGHAKYTNTEGLDIDAKVTGVGHAKYTNTEGLDIGLRKEVGPVELTYSNKKGAGWAWIGWCTLM